MPSLDLPLGPQGPLVQVRIGASLPHLRALGKLNKRIPPNVQGSFLIDTGASHSAVDIGLISATGLQPTGSVPINTPSTGTGTHLCDEYDIHLVILAGGAGPSLVIEAMPVLASDFRSQGIDGLIGRDVLERCLLIINGPAKRATLAF